MQLPDTVDRSSYNVTILASWDLNLVIEQEFLIFQQRTFYPNLLCQCDIELVYVEVLISQIEIPLILKVNMVILQLFKFQVSQSAISG